MANAGLVPTLGTPVVCHGLQKATHINGKIEDVRGFDRSAGRCEVHFKTRVCSR